LWELVIIATVGRLHGVHPRAPGVVMPPSMCVRVVSRCVGAGPGVAARSGAWAAMGGRGGGSSAPYPAPRGGRGCIEPGRVAPPAMGAGPAGAGSVCQARAYPGPGGGGRGCSLGERGGRGRRGRDGRHGGGRAAGLHGRGLRSRAGGVALVWPLPIEAGWSAKSINFRFGPLTLGRGTSPVAGNWLPATIFASLWKTAFAGALAEVFSPSESSIGRSTCSGRGWERRGSPAAPGAAPGRAGRHHRYDKLRELRERLCHIAGGAAPSR